jgi:hypothetical protein
MFNHESFFFLQDDFVILIIRQHLLRLPPTNLPPTWIDFYVDHEMIYDLLGAKGLPTKFFVLKLLPWHPWIDSSTFWLF